MESFDAFRYIGYMRSRWRWIAISCAVAAAIALAVSLSQTRQYTATARIVIEPPAGSDLRAAMAVSPIYLESLKTYEHFATGDSLFQKALEQMNLRSLLGSRPIESIKKRVLKVEIVRNTRILEISATLPDARKAQALAQFIAESTADMNRALGTEGDRELLKGMEQQRDELRARLDQIDAAWSKVLSAEPTSALQADQENAAFLRSTIEQQAIEAEVAAAHDRAAELRKQLQAMDRQSAEREKTLAARQAHRDRLDAERKAAQTALISAETRLREARGESGYRGERLRVVDPGIVPERPSSPNVPLNVVGALLLGLVLSILYLTLAMAYHEQPSGVIEELAKTRPAVRHD
jgi:uncharacterized protein involved in exopolysaccharide biosynthesis